MKYTVAVYETEFGERPLQVYLLGLRDAEAKRRIVQRILRAQAGNLGDHHSVGDGIHELRIDYGPGYRVYYAWRGQTIVMLFCAGDKRTQDADIARAVSYRNDLERRNP